MRENSFDGLFHGFVGLGDGKCEENNGEEGLVGHIPDKSQVPEVSKGAVPWSRTLRRDWRGQGFFDHVGSSISTTRIVRKKSIWDT